MKSQTKMINTLTRVGVSVALLCTLSLAEDLAPQSDYFIDATLGLSQTPIQRDDKAGTLDIKNLDTRGYNVTLACGYNYTNTIAFTTTYQRVMQEDIHIDNIYLGAEYSLLKTNNFAPYLGAALGYSRVTWDNSPINNTLRSDMKSGSYLIGVTIGTTYTITKDFSLIANYQLQLLNHSVALTLDADKSELNHKAAHNLNLGVRCFF